MEISGPKSPKGPKSRNGEGRWLSTKRFLKAADLTFCQPAEQQARLATVSCVSSGSSHHPDVSRRISLNFVVRIIRK